MITAGNLSPVYHEHAWPPTAKDPIPKPPKVNTVEDPVAAATAAAQADAELESERQMLLRQPGVAFTIYKGIILGRVDPAKEMGVRSSREYLQSLVDYMSETEKRTLNVGWSLAVDLLNPLESSEKRSHKLKRLVQSPNSFFMDVKCPGCFAITTVFSHAQTVVLCGSCATVLSQPTGGKARLTEGCSFRKKSN
ncbi:40S ribosomal protein S27 [Irineochytrium annulatum]|nr:40S ribosomal protein S27 [Irineochytrium annulatum]